MANDEVLYLRLPAELKARLEAEAAARTITVSTLARVLLLESLDELELEETEAGA